jgi:uncharacterized membrane protein YfcA
MLPYVAVVVRSTLSEIHDLSTSGAADAANALAGVMLGPVMILGSIVGKKIVDRLSERMFVALVEITLLVAGVGFLTGRW